MQRHVARSLTVIVVVGFAVVSVLAEAAEPPVSGVFKGNGKDAKIAFVSAHRREPFNDKPSLVLVFTEKDHSKDAKPDFRAAFGNFGSALIISVHEDGGIFGCEVAHSALKGTFSSLGRIKMSDFKIADGKIQGQLATEGQVETFGQTWEVNLKFVTTAPAAVAQPTSTPAAADKPLAKQPGDRPSASPRSKKPAPAQPAEALSVKDLPLPKDAKDVQFKTLVEQIVFKSPSDVKTLAAALAQSLQQQGWTRPSPDLVTANSAILNRAKGDATLTLMVKPAEGGSHVTIFSSGLSWEDK
jgi:hypothetical protein